MPGVVICDDHRVFGQALGAVLEGHGYQVLACSHDPESGVAAVARHQPDLYVVDLHFPGGSSLTGLGALADVSPHTRVVVLSGSSDPKASSDARRAGASGFVAKDRPIDEILAAVRNVVEGGSVFHETDRRRPGSRAGAAGPNESIVKCLTTREREVLDRLVEGQDTATLARSLGVTYSTARTHIQSVLAKLGVHSRLEAVALVMADQD